MKTSRAKKLKIIQFVIYSTFVLLLCAHLCVAMQRQNMADQAASYRRPVTHGEMLNYMREAAPSAYVRLRERGLPTWQPTSQQTMSTTGSNEAAAMSADSTVR